MGSKVSGMRWERKEKEGDACVCSLGEKSFSQCLSHNGCLVNIYMNTVHCYDDCFYH